MSGLIANASVVANRTFVRDGFSDDQILAVAQQKRPYIAAWIRALASQRGIAVRWLPSDSFVKAVSCLSDGVVDLDPVEDLLIALGRAGVLTSYQSSLLQANYLE